MTLEDRVKMAIGELTLANLSLQTQMEALEKKYQDAVKQPKDGNGAKVPDPVVN